MYITHELIPAKPCGYIGVGDPYDKKKLNNREVNKLYKIFMSFSPKKGRILKKRLLHILEPVEDVTSILLTRYPYDLSFPDFFWLVVTISLLKFDGLMKSIKLKKNFILLYIIVIIAACQINPFFKISFTNVCAICSRLGSTCSIDEIREHFKEVSKNKDETIIFSEFIQLIKRDENILYPLLKTRQYYRRVFLSESVCKRIEKRVDHYKFAEKVGEDGNVPPQLPLSSTDSCWLRCLAHFNKSYHPYYYNYKLMDDGSTSVSEQLDIYLFKLCQIYCPSLKRDRRSIPRVNQLIIESGRKVKPTSFNKDKTMKCPRKSHYQLANLPVSTRSVNAVEAGNGGDKNNVFNFTGQSGNNININNNNNVVNGEYPNNFPATTGGITKSYVFFPSYSENESDRKFSTPNSGYTNYTANTSTTPVTDSNRTILLPGQCNI